MKKTQIKKQKAKRKAESDNESVKQEIQVKEQDGQVKNQEDQGPKRWFEDDDDDDHQNKWQYLQHHGVTFPDPFIPRGLSVLHEGAKIQLNPYEQQLAWYWAQSIGTQYENSDIYRKNFANQFVESLKKRYSEIKSLQKLDFSGIKHLMQKQRQQKKNRPQTEKAKQKKLKQQRDKFYGFALVDGTIQKVNGSQIQPPTLFKGRGKHPRQGYLKPRIMPEQLTLNLAEQAPIPKCHVAGRSWGAIECKKDSTWLCSYKNDTISSSSTYKYIFLAANSKFKGQNDRRKYEKARRLKRCIDKIREDYFKKIQSSDLKNKQLGTATYLIDNLALRVGNQKGEDEADTQGCCSLRFQHIQNLDDNYIKLDFLGKDSMQYINTVKVHPNVWKNIELFKKNKKQGDQLFDKIDAQVLNDYLKSQMQGLTAKVFRTYNASTTLQQQLNKVNLQGLTMQQKKQKYEQANKQVAILCNHQKSVGKKFVQNLNKKQQYIQKLKQYLSQLQKHKSLFTAKKDTINRPDQVIQVQGIKPFPKKYPESKQATQTAIKKLKQRIEKQQKALKKKDDNKQIALGTSKTNYNDPRISVAWCKKNEVKVQKIFPKTLLSKFLWAMYSDADFQF